MEYQIFLDEANMNQISLHRVGNKSQDEGFRLAKMPLALQGETQEVLSGYLLSGFKTEKLYELNNEHDLSMNEVYTTVRAMFDNPEDSMIIHAGSKDLAKILYSKSNHVKIKGGELYVALISECIFNDEIVNAIGIFKAESKETFLKLKMNESEEWTFDFQEGSNASKIDKGCIIFDIDKETGFKVLHLDQKSADAKFFKDDFLAITEVQDEKYHTKAYLDLCNSLAKKFDFKSTLDKVHFLQSCKDYFEHYKEFELEEFKSIVIGSDSPVALELSNALHDEYLEFIDLGKIDEGFDEEFFIDAPVAKKSSRKLKTTIKLDTQIDMKINSSSCKGDGFIEQGFDEEKQMNYYKVYFNNQKA